MVAGEWPAGAIRAVHARREADDEQPMARAAEGSHGAAVISRMPRPDFIEEVCKTRAEPAIRIERRALHARPSGAQRALNCASSVDPRIAVMDEVPAVTVWVTSSK